jgi:two-component system cell cycle response regulator DivK
VVLTRNRSHAVLVELIHDRHRLGRASARVADQQLERAPTDTAQPVDVGNSKLESGLEMAPRFKKTRARQRHHAAHPNRSITCGHHKPILRRDYEITEAENGEQALAAIAKQRPDLILMDIQLPIMDGYTATRRIKADPALRSIPIIAVTSYVLSGEEMKARATGCDSYVPKPFSPRKLLPKIRHYLL